MLYIFYNMIYKDITNTPSLLKVQWLSLPKEHIVTCSSYMRLCNILIFLTGSIREIIIYIFNWHFLKRKMVHFLNLYWETTANAAWFFFKCQYSKLCQILQLSQTFKRYTKKYLHFQNSFIFYKNYYFPKNMKKM